MIGLTLWKKLSERNLLPKESFYSKLNDRVITDKDFERFGNISR